MDQPPLEGVVRVADRRVWRLDLFGEIIGSAEARSAYLMVRLCEMFTSLVATVVRHTPWYATNALDAPLA